MKLIRTSDGCIKVDPQHCEPGYVWGQRWNTNTQDWGLCMLWKSHGAVDISEKDLPKKLEEI